MKKDRIELPGKPGDWLFVCDSAASEVRYCNTPELQASDWHALSAREVKGKRVVVLAHELGPGAEKASEIVKQCHELGAAAVYRWVVPALGMAETPTLRAWTQVFELAHALAKGKPWLEENAVAPPAGVLPAIKSDGQIDYQALTDEELGLIPASSIQIEPVNWLWKHRLARGEMALLAGEAGMGKSQILLAIIAAVSNGGVWPDGKEAPRGHCILLSAEDSPQQSILPRLRALGADLNNVTLLRATVRFKRKVGDREEPVVDAINLQDLAYWRAAVKRRTDTVLLVIDPVVAYFGRGIDDTRSQHIRAVLGPFIDEIIRPNGLCLLCNAHLNKAIESSNPLHRISGSNAYHAVPRNVLMVGKDPEDGQRFLGQAKCNIAPDGLPLITYRIEPAIVEGVETSKVVFGSGIQLSLRRVFAAERERGPEPEKSSRFGRWLWDQLQDGPRSLIDLVKRAREAGLLKRPTKDDPKPSKSPLYDAKARMLELYPDAAIRSVCIRVNGQEVKAWSISASK